MNTTKKVKPFRKSFLYALRGISYSLKTERNLRIHFVAAFWVIICSFLFRLAILEWLLIIYAIGSVIIAELFNTALERVVDLTQDKYDFAAGVAKDAAAGAVLVAAVQSVVIGVLIFGPRLHVYLTNFIGR